MPEKHASGLLRIALSAVAVLLVAVGAACGGSSAAKTATTTASAGNGTDFAAAFQAYRACLGRHGVTLSQRTPGSGGPPPSDAGAGGNGGGLPPGGFGGGGFGGTPQSLPKGVTASQYAAAQKACASKLPSGGFPGGGTGGGQAFQAYLSCLRDHGVANSGGASPTTAVGASRSQPTFNRNDPKFAAANKVCQALLPNRSTTTTSG